MNRKQRRAKPKKRKIIDYDLFLKKFTFLLESNVHEPLDQETIDSFQVPWEAALNSLRFGTAQDGDFEVLSIMLILGVELADIIGRYDKTGQITAAGNGYREYGKALYKIGVRHNNTGRYVATGDELYLLAEAKNINLQLLSLSNQSHVLKAAQQTGHRQKEMIQKLLKERNGKTEQMLTPNHTPA